MPDESKLDDPAVAKEVAQEIIAESASAQQAEIESENEDEENASTTATAPAGTAAKKKKSKKKRIKSALAGGSGDAGEGSSREQIDKAVNSLSKKDIDELLKMNPALAAQLGVNEGSSTSQAAEALKRLKLEDIMTGLAASGKNVKDMGSYKFWGTQPVPKFGETGELKEGPLKVIDPEQVPKEPGPLVEGFEWVTMDLLDDKQLQEVFELLYGHFVEDDEGMFRFNYSKPFLRWALLAPGWHKDWHVGVRASASRKLVAFISAIPVNLRVRAQNVVCSEVNFLCVHKKLRSKRLAPVLIKEITRISYRRGIFQGLYTGGVVLPRPVSTTRYFHRSLDWQKLNDVGFSPLPPGSKPSFQIRKYALPERTATKGLRPMERKDIDGVLDLLKRFLLKYEMAPIFTREEIEHWLFTKKEDEVVWSYVVEDPSTKKLTDFFSFYNLESSVINHPKHNNVKAAYLYYYATDVALVPEPSKDALKTRLNELVHDALILAKQNKFDVFNALTLADNCLFLEKQLFGAGDGQLHYYLYNYATNPIAGGVDKRNQIDENCSGIGLVML